MNTELADNKIILCWPHSAADFQNVNCQCLRTPVVWEMGGSVICETVNKSKRDF